MEVEEIGHWEDSEEVRKDVSHERVRISILIQQGTPQFLQIKFQKENIPT